nr:hypothetical protein [Tanacetum cinerariifolium]
MVFLLQKGVCVEIGITAARLSSYCSQANISVVWLLRWCCLNQVGDLSTHTIRFISLALTQKVFENMRRVGKENIAEDVAHDTIPSPPSHAIPSPSQEPSSPPQQLQSSPQAPPQEAGNYQAEGKGKEVGKANMVKSSKLRRLRKVGASRRIESSDDMEDVFNQGG